MFTAIGVDRNQPTAHYSCWFIDKTLIIQHNLINSSLLCSCCGSDRTAGACLLAGVNINVHFITMSDARSGAFTTSAPDYR